VNLGGVARVEWPLLRAASVRRLDPGVIVLAAYSGSASPAAVAAREGWELLAAVRAGRVWAWPAALVKRTDPP
jgi:ABC-type Fe3+-hydroxamate transport system substrate-binding protein